MCRISLNNNITYNTHAAFVTYQNYARNIDMLIGLSGFGKCFECCERVRTFVVINQPEAQCVNSEITTMCARFNT